MIDTEEYDSNFRPWQKGFVLGSTIDIEPDEQPVLNEDQLLMCTDTIAGFSLVSKQWGLLDVDHVREIDFNTSAFDMLALSKDKKDTIAALVRNSKASSNTYDDLIKGKGKGVIFLLHGPAGVGKTFTAGELPLHLFYMKTMSTLTLRVESIADVSQRPLYTLNCSDLGVEDAEMRLTDALSLATKWNAVALIDEADVFMAQRSLNDLARNEMVSGLSTLYHAL
jgi:hypothetical protein